MYRKSLGLLVSLLLAGCGGGGGDNQFAKDSYPTQSCPSNMTCDFMKAPKDYNNPNGEQVDIYYGVHKALDPANRIGSLILNFGGPSAEAVGGAGYMVEKELPKEILDRFDIVGMDPRGTGQSAFAKELTDCAVAQSNKQGDCSATYSQVAPFLGSNTVVKDMDMLRNLLGDEKLTFLGYSYGTRLGSLYAYTFPERVRAIVLDSPMSPMAENNVELRVGNTAGYDKVAAFRLDYATYPNRETRYQHVVDSLFSSTMSYVANDGAMLSLRDGISVMNLTVAREHFGDWQKIDDGLENLLDYDNASSLLNELSTNGFKSSRSRYSSSEDSLRGSALFKAVVCTDERSPLTDGELLASEYRYKSASSLYGSLTYHSTSELCKGWSAQRDPIPAVTDMASALGGKQILIIGGQYDPATPYTWTEEMAASFGASASKIMVDNYVDHGFSYSNISCVDQKTTAYLLDPDTKVAEETCDASALSQNKSFMIAPDTSHPAKDVIGW
ncbi:alpha/beta hydrolase [Photobacterium alginatilyticum]|nr:alpha/beta hydrolase [Photobacterium alginatilyticum]